MLLSRGQQRRPLAEGKAVGSQRWSPSPSQDCCQCQLSGQVPQRQQRQQQQARLTKNPGQQSGSASLLLLPLPLSLPLPHPAWDPKLLGHEHPCGPCPSPPCMCTPGWHHGVYVHPLLRHVKQRQRCLSSWEVMMLARPARQ